jgi:pimeloyl-ACP methyl ester carboxylesterase
MTQQNFITSDGTRIAFDDQGSGLALLCLSGLTRNASDFDYMLPHLPPCRVIRMDYRGRGGSQWSGPETYTVPREGRDAIELLDHLGIPKAAILGTSRGGMIGMFLAATARDRLLGLCLNDVGPALLRGGLEKIKDYVGRNPASRTLEDAASALETFYTGFANVPRTRWLDEARRHCIPDGKGGLKINYDPALRESFLAAFEGETPDLWPLFDACAGLPLALIRGANSDLLGAEDAAEMRRRRPDMIVADVPDRAHIPFLDEPESVAVLQEWLAHMRDA